MEKTEAKTIGQVIKEHATEVAGVAGVAVVTAKAAEEKKVQAARKQATKKTGEKEGTAAEAARLQKEIEEKTAALQATLRELERKQKLNKNRSKFLQVLDQLAEFEAKLRDENDFETSVCKMAFSEGGYSRTELFTISCTPVLLDGIGFLRDRIERKVSEIEAELIR